MQEYVTTDPCRASSALCLALILHIKVLCAVCTSFFRLRPSDQQPVTHSNFVDLFDIKPPPSNVAQISPFLLRASWVNTRYFTVCIYLLVCLFIHLSLYLCEGQLSSDAKMLSSIPPAVFDPGPGQMSHFCLLKTLQHKTLYEDRLGLASGVSACTGRWPYCGAWRVT